MGTLLQDLHYSLRVLFKRNSVATIVAIFTLGLGIGATTAIFSVVNSILIRPLPYKDPEKLIVLYEQNLDKGLDNFRVSPGDFIDWKEQNQVFEQVAAIRFKTFLVTGRSEPEWITGGAVSPNLFALLGVQPILGRTFFPEEEKTDQSNVVILSYGFWQHYLGSDRNIIGQTLTLDGKNYVVVGIVPRGFEFPKKFDLWVPLTVNLGSPAARRARFLQVVARLKSGVKLEYAQAHMSTIASRLQQAYPDTNAGWGVKLTSLYEETVKNIGSVLILFLCATGFVLLIACTNVANLQLARATVREKEIAIRTALGAGRYRLIRQFLTENLLLTFIGGLIGILLAFWGTHLFIAFAPADIPRLTELNIDSRVLIFTLAISLLTGVVFGLVRVLTSLRANFSHLKEGGQRFTGGVRGYRFLSGLVVFEVALAFILLTGAGLMIRSFLRLQNVDPGFEAANVLTMRLSLSELKYREPNQQRIFFQQLLEQIAALPGVEEVGATTELPIGGASSAFPVAVEGRSQLPPDEQARAFYNAVSPNYFQAMGIPLVKGGFFTEDDKGEQAPKVVIIDETLAHRFWPDEDPIGKRLMIFTGKPTLHDVIGVVRAIKYQVLDSNVVIPAVYVSYHQSPQSRMALVIRTASNPIHLTDSVRHEVRKLDKDQPISYLNTMEQLLSESLSKKRFYTLLFSVFAIIALLLAAAGIYGVTSYSVAQRTHEIGIRMALGAQRINVLKLVIGKYLIMVTIGLLMGTAAAFALTQFLSSLLYEITTTDPFTFLVVMVILMATALFACYVPARRATVVDPVIALRYE
jgi:predicted permease